MLNNSTHYHSTIRKVIVAFGNLFSNITIVREDKSNRGNDQTIQVPIAYSCKEKWVVRIDSDPDLNNHTYTTLPRIAFEITGYEYDSTRKTNKMSFVTVNGPRTYIGPYHDYYDAITTPSLFILDQRKKIIAKKIPAEKLEDFFVQYEKFHKK